jgi:hypothetical protein
MSVAHNSTWVALEEATGAGVVIARANMEEGDFVVGLVAPGAGVAVAVVRAADSLAEGGVDHAGTESRRSAR